MNRRFLLFVGIVLMTVAYAMPSQFNDSNAAFTDSDDIAGTVSSGEWLGTIEIVKKTNADVGQSFSFTGTGDSELTAFNIVGTIAGASISAEVDTRAGGAFTVTEGTLPSGWTLSSVVCVDSETDDSSETGATANIQVEGGETVVCTFTNSQAAKTFIVKKDFDDNVADEVTVGLSCGTATVSPPSAQVSEGSPATFTVTNYAGDVSCVATESPVPAGYTSTATCTNTLFNGATGCTITNELNRATFTVSKAYDPSNVSPVPGPVMITISCDAGDIADNTLVASPGNPAVFDIAGIPSPGTQCQVDDEAEPAGFTWVSGCTSPVNVPFNSTTANCEIVNKLNTAQLTVLKNFIPDSGALVSMSVSCTGGAAPAATPLDATGDGAGAVFTINRVPAGGTDCTATEALPAGYAQSGTTCSPVNLVPDEVTSCTITNTQNSATFNVLKAYDGIPATPPAVSIELTCGSGTVTVDGVVDNTDSAAPGGGNQATFVVVGIVGASTTCTAVENPVPNGYTSDHGTTCLNITLTFNGTASCTITNELTDVPPPPPCVNANIYIMLDRTGSMVGSTDEERAGAIALVTKFESLVNQPKVAIGSFGGGTATHLRNLNAVYGDNDGLQDGDINNDIYGGIEIATASPTGRTDISAAVSVARTHLGLSNVGTDILILLSDGDTNEPDDDVEVNRELAYDQSDLAKAASVRVLTIFFGEEADGFAGSELLAAMASGGVTPPDGGDDHHTHGHANGSNAFTANENGDGDNFFTTPNAGELNNIFTQVLDSGAICTPGAFDPVGSISVTVDTNNQAQDMTFTSTINNGTCSPDSPGTSFVLDDESGDEPETETCTGVTATGSNYTVNWTPIAGWLVTSIACTGDAEVLYGADLDAIFEIGETQVTVNLDPGEDVDCTFTIRNDRAVVKVTKVDATNTGTDFSFSDDFTAGCNVVQLDDDNGGNNALQDSKTCVVQSGTNRDIWETVPAGWRLTAVTCTGAGVTGIEYGINGGSHDGTFTVGTDNSIRFDLAAATTADCTFTNTQNVSTVTVSKDFSDNNAATVTIVLTCTSGTVTSSDTTAAEGGNTAVFTVTGYNTAGTTCTATDTVAGYSAGGCVNQALTPNNPMACTVTNTFASATVTVSKNFTPDNAATVTVVLTCTSGTVSSSDSIAAEGGNNAVFTVTGFAPGATCSATDTVAGYTTTACSSIPLTAGGTPSCTILNTQNSATVTISKNFASMNNSTVVTIVLTCTSGTVTSSDTAAAEGGNNAVFTVKGFIPGATCLATDTVPGYTASGCPAIALTHNGTPACTVVNTKDPNTSTFTVTKNFLDNKTGDVTVNLTCTSGTVTVNDATAQETPNADTAEFTVNGFTTGATCTATDTVTGYLPGGCNTVAIVDLGAATCTLTNARQFIFQNGASAGGAGCLPAIGGTGNTMTHVAGGSAAALPAVVVPAASDDAVAYSFTTLAGTPNKTSWLAGTYTVKFDVAAEGDDIDTYRVRIWKVAANCTSAVVIGTSTQVNDNGPGVKTHTVTGALATFLTTDRLMVQILVDTDNESAANRTLTLNYGSVDTSVQIPF